jgi:TonB family protein
MPKWTPGKQRGKAVKTKYTLPVNFKLDGGVSLGAVSKANNSSDEIVYIIVEQMPKFNGDLNGDLNGYLAKNIKYPEEARKSGIQGRVIIQFVVDKDGSISDVNVVRGVCPALDAEAIRVVKSMPNWTPGKQRGQNVRVKYTLPINFSLTK